MSSDASNLVIDWKIKNCEMDFTDPNIKHDRILVVEGQKFHVISEFLSFSSEFFQGLFNPDSEFKEANEKEIEIKDVTAEDFKEFLKAVYPGTFTLTNQNYRPMMALATRFLSGIVIQKCRKFMLDEFDKLDPLDVLEVAFQYDMEDVKEKFAVFLRKKTTVQCSCCEDLTGPTCKKFIYNYFSTDLTSEHSTFIGPYETRQRISTLPVEAQAFILDIILNPLEYPM